MAVIFIAGLNLSCATKTPEIIPDDDREIVQLAQNAYNDGNWRLAEFYYNELLKKFGENPAVYVEGKFELAHIYVNKKHYLDAIPLLEEIITIYDNAPYGSLPPEFKKLARNDLNRIPQEKMDEYYARNSENLQ